MATLFCSFVDETADKIGITKEQRIQNIVMSNNNLGPVFEDSRQSLCKFSGSSSM